MKVPSENHLFGKSYILLLKCLAYGRRRETLAVIDTLDNYFFYITNRRLLVVFIRNQFEKQVKAHRFVGSIGALFAYDDYKQHIKELQGFEILFNELEFISSNKSRLGGEINIKSKKWWKFLKVNKEQF